MKCLLIILLLVISTGCAVLVDGSRPPKFSNGQKVRTIENRLEVLIVGTACDVRDSQQSFESCRYLVRLPFRGNRTLMFEEAELEEIK